MPNVRRMEDRMASHLARVGAKALEREYDRILDLARTGRISWATERALRNTAAIRLAWKMNAA